MHQQRRRPNARQRAPNGQPVQGQAAPESRQHGGNHEAKLTQTEHKQAAGRRHHAGRVLRRRLEAQSSKPPNPSSSSRVGPSSSGSGAAWAASASRAKSSSRGSPVPASPPSGAAAAPSCVVPSGVGRGPAVPDRGFRRLRSVAVRGPAARRQSAAELCADPAPDYPMSSSSYYHPDCW